MCTDCLRPAARLSRRDLIHGAAALAGATLLTTPAWTQTSPKAATPDEALQLLMAGNARYTAGTPSNQDHSAGRVARASGQSPFAAILSCADSRVVPELAFDQGPGDLFVARVAGNFVNDDILASLEYTVKFLGTPLIVVLGHSNCGAVDAALKVVRDGTTLPGHLQDMVREITPAAKAAERSGRQDILAAAVEENVRLGVHRLETAKPILSDMVEAGKLKVVGAHYELSTGQITLVERAA